jgi:hypothetical protein
MLSISPGTGAAASNNIAPLSLFEHANTVSTDYTISLNDNALSAGPVTVNDGIVVTVPAGSIWTIV